MVVAFVEVSVLVEEVVLVGMTVVVGRCFGVVIEVVVVVVEGSRSSVTATEKTWQISALITTGFAAGGSTISPSYTAVHITSHTVSYSTQHRARRDVGTARHC